MKPVHPSDLSRSFKFPKKAEYRGKISIFLDLDETLVHCNDNIRLPSDIVLNIQVSKFENVKVIGFTKYIKSGRHKH
jgi:CTD small phosphatase-like protein 2